VGEIDGIEATILPFEPQDYGNFPAPALFSRLELFEAAHCARAKFNKLNLDGDSFDAFFFQGFELLPGFRDIIKRTPTVLAHDSTNIASYRLISQWQRSFSSQLTSLIKASLLFPVYFSILKNIDIFLPRSNWCKDSLVSDYKVPVSRIMVTPGTIDLSEWQFPPKTWPRRPTLLFVGNDFVRKGGAFLVEVYSKFLSELTFLHIISNDPVVANHIGGLKGITWVKGIDHSSRGTLIREYEKADIFVHPTFKDQLGLALLEACASNLPLVGRDTGGVSDIVRDGYSGILLKYDSQEREWASAISALIQKPEKSMELGRNARKIVETDFSESAFKEKLVLALLKATSSN
jgi:glycosyltransferase involved in cell wall biosynthesis